jgi:hypothetical protein
VFQQFAAIEWFHQEGNGAVPEGLSAYLLVVMGGDDDDRQFGLVLSNPPLQLRPVHPGQSYICDDTRHARERAGQQKRFRGCESDGFVSGGFKDALNGFSNATIVVDRCDDHSRPRHQDGPIRMRRIVRSPGTPG